MTKPVQELRERVAALPETTGPDLRMQDLLDAALDALPALLQDRGQWQSLYIDYEPPFLMRLSLPIEAGGRRMFLSLHYFFGLPEHDMAHALKNPYAEKPELISQESANNYHPHPWASAFLLLEGSYDQRIGYADTVGYNDAARPMPHDLWHQDAGDPQKARYAFNDKLLWHQLLPSDGKPVSSVMLTYIPKDWDQTGPKPPQQQRPLTQQERDFMFGHFEKMLADRRMIPSSRPQKRAGFRPRT